MSASGPLDISTASLDRFLAGNLEDPAFAGAVADRAGLSEPDAADLLSDLASEARLACRMLAEVRPVREDRILEVGAGAGVLAAFLHERGANLLAIEPIVDGYESFMAVRSLLSERASLPVIEPLRAEQLSPTEHGQFDLIFSVNVLEHMRPLEPNLDALAAVLAPGGRMVHTCPNYRVPYEPHYRIALVPGRPALTRHIARRAAREPVWDSLNWIAAGDVERFADRHGLRLEFRQGQLASALQRLRHDPAFARRQRGPVVGALRVLDKVGVTGLLGRIPATWMTPMTFTITRPGRPNRSNH
ncbi:MAG TPA: methyltransferase domain-containing protein [Micromonosporaceae bacterium]|nr:methyltransferase domain-containing protein [Micromonosporaceae bacterium]